MRKPTLAALLLISALHCHADTGRAEMRQDSAAQFAARFYIDGDYQKVIGLKPFSDSASLSPDLSYYQGMSYAALYDYPRAQALLQNAVRGDPANVKYRFQYGRFLVQAGFMDEAANELTTCTALDSTYLPAWFQLGLLYSAQKTKPANEAEIFSFLVRRNPDDFLSLYYLGDALKRLDLEDSGMVFIQRSIGLNPRYFPSLIALAHHRSANKDYASALEAYQRAEAIRPRDKDLLFNIGECLRKLGSYPAAVGYFTRSIAIDSSYSYSHAQLGYTYYLMNRIDSSIVEYNKAIAIDEDKVSFYSNLALAFEKIDSVEGVIESHQRLIRSLHPENISYAYKNLAIYYSKISRKRDAARAYERVYEYNPSNVMALYWAGVWYASIPDNESAIRAYEQYLHLIDGDSTKGWDRQHVSDIIGGLRKKQR